MKRSPLPPSRRGLARRIGLASMSPKRRREVTTRRAVVAEVLERDGHRCRAVGLVYSVRCAGPLDVHEVIPRDAWREGYLVPSNCIAICRAHHEWVTVHPRRAHELGLHGYSWERAS